MYIYIYSYFLILPCIRWGDFMPAARAPAPLADGTSHYNSNRYHDNHHNTTTTTTTTTTTIATKSNDHNNNNSDSNKNIDNDNDNDSRQQGRMSALELCRGAGTSAPPAWMFRQLSFARNSQR